MLLCFVAVWLFIPLVGLLVCWLIGLLVCCLGCFLVCGSLRTSRCLDENLADRGRSVTSRVAMGLQARYESDVACPIKPLFAGLQARYKGDTPV